MDPVRWEVKCRLIQGELGGNLGLKGKVVAKVTLLHIGIFIRLPKRNDLND